MDELEKAMFVLRLVSPTTAIFTAITLAIVLAPFFYVIVRWRANRDHVQDPQVGIKFALYYVGLFAFQLTLFGLMLLFFTMICSKESSMLIAVMGGEKGPVYRAALGLMVPGAIMLGGHIALLRKTNDDQYIGLRRTFGGINLLFTGLIAFLGLIAGFQALFAKEGTGLGHFAAAVIFTYGVAWGALVWWYGKLVLGGGGFVTLGGGQHHHGMMPPMAQPMPPPSAYTALPPLGAYPPPPPEQR